MSRGRTEVQEFVRQSAFIILMALAGLLLTPIVYYAIGRLLFSHQPGYSEGGDGFRIAMVALYVAPLAAFYAGMAAGLGLRPGHRTVKRWLVVIGVYLAGGCLIQMAVASGNH